jgi:hypothetical protein
MLKFLRVATVIAVLSPALAHADLPNGAMLTWEKTKIHQDGGTDLTQPSTDSDLRKYLNLAHCECSKAGLGKEQTMSMQLRSTADTNTHRPVELWVGTECTDETLRGTHCRRLDDLGIPDIDILFTRPATVEFSLFDVINGVSNADTDACQEREGDAFLWTLVDTNGDNTYDDVQSYSVGTGVFSTVTKVDTLAPPLPTEFKGSSSEGGVSLDWKVPLSNATDVYAYEVYCARADDGSPGKATPSGTIYHQTSKDLCGLEQNIAMTPTDITEDASDEMPVTTVPDGLTTLDPAYLCKSSQTQTASGLLVDGLENDVPYIVALVSVDHYGNAVGVSFTSTITPHSATDFWEDLHDRGSKVEGGFCLGTTTPWGGGPGAGLLALAIAFILVPRSRRRSFIRILAPASALLVFGLATPAHAQTPYWANDDKSSSDEAVDLGDDTVKWNIGLRLGPYTPQIDSQLGGTGDGPYKQMFGGYRVLPMVDVDRIVWRGFGQLGFGGSIGYMQKTAHAYAEGTSPSDPDRMRTPGNDNTFRLLPLQGTAVYRLTVLDELYGIPIVPYIRGGLAYYLWMIRTNGKTATACIGGGDTSTCSGGEKALGGTLGVTGSIGIAIRAERVDAATALSMRQSGIEHAGFYAELNFAKVNGFGSDAKLSVGDNTWFVGANFEF